MNTKLQKGQIINIIQPNPYCQYTGKALLVSDYGKESILIKGRIAYSFVPYGKDEHSESYLTYDYCIEPVDITEQFKA